MRVISSVGGRIGNIFFRTLTGKYLADQLGCPFTAVWEGNSLAYEHGETDGQYFKAIMPYFTNINMDPDARHWYEVQHLANKEAGPSKATVINPTGDLIVIGGNRHSPRYWNDDKSYALEVFKSTWDPEIYGFIEKTYHDIDLPSLVSVHVRRGDFCKLGIAMSEQWYLKAINTFTSTTKFLVISDDILWCKNYFKGDRFIFADRPKDSFPHQGYLIDLYLQRICRHNIIANSTFSWWAAYLNETKNRQVLYPWPWLAWAGKDFIPKNDNWVAISR